MGRTTSTFLWPVALVFACLGCTPQAEESKISAKESPAGELAHSAANGGSATAQGEAQGEAQGAGEQKGTDRHREAGTDATKKAVAGGVLSIPWWEDDVERALKAARVSHTPVVVDMWAPWCHTCLSMQSTVLKDPRVVAFRDRFTWLSVDTDRDVNASLVDRLEMSMWPTFFVLDETGQQVLGVFGGAASVDQFEQFLNDSLAASTQGNPDLLSVQLAAAGQAIAQGRHEAAKMSLEAILAKAPSSWPRRADVLVELARILARQHASQACASLLTTEQEAIAASRSASTTDFILYVNRCIEGLPDVKRDTLRKTMRDILRRVADDADAHLSTDDRSDLLYNLRKIHLSLGEEDAAKAVARAQRDLLARAFQQTTSREEAAIYAWPRAEVHVYLGEASSLLPDLEALARDLPTDYDPAYRLGWLLQQMGRTREAIGPLRSSLELVYGPRKAKVWATLAEVYETEGDQQAARNAWSGIVTHLEKMSDHDRYAGLLEKAKAAVVRLDARSALPRSSP